MEKSLKRTILIAPLDWGLGHASRCISVIRHYKDNGHTVLLASNGRSAALLRTEFPDLKIFTDIPDYNIKYPEHENFTSHFLKNSIRILRVIRAEHNWLAKLIQKEKIDWVISDNRYGLYHEAVTSYFMTHQLFIPAPGMLRIITTFANEWFIKQFSLCLVPDFAGDNNLSGRLSHGKTRFNNVRYIGPLSRFGVFNGIPDEDVYSNETPVNTESISSFYEYEFAIVLSGPEPARTKFRDLMVKLFSGYSKPSILIEGRTEATSTEHISNLLIVPHLKHDKFHEEIRKSQYILCRSGYSTIMDLYFLGRKAILVPTPGQTEQSYLALYHNRKGGHCQLSQDQLQLISIDELKQIATKS